MNTSLGLCNRTLSRIQHAHWLQPTMRPLTHGWHVAFAVIGICVLFVGGFVGNLMVIQLFIRFRDLRSYSNMFVLNLTVADFLLCVGNIPMFIIANFCGLWVFDVIGCEVYAFIGSVASFVSINTLAAIAIDRCTVIVRIFSSDYRSPRPGAYVTVALIWIYSALWAVAPLSGWGKFILEGANTSCTFDFLTRTASNRSYVVGIFGAHFVVPVSVICCSYSLILKRVLRARRELSVLSRVFGQGGLPIRWQNQQKGMNNELKTAVAALVIILVFCIAWSPYATVALIGEFGDINLITPLGSGIPCLCAKASTALNPFIYALLHPKFRAKLLNDSLYRKTSKIELKEAIQMQLIKRGTRTSFSVL